MQLRQRLEKESRKWSISKDKNTCLYLLLYILNDYEKSPLLYEENARHSKYKSQMNEFQHISQSYWTQDKYL